MSWLAFALGCASWFGLEVIDELPADFPLEPSGEIGHITRTRAGHVAVDEVFEDAEAARAAWETQIARATSRGFTETSRERRDKRDVAVLEGARGRLELQCCPRRADRKALVLVSWFPK